jgi:hypothetical protein
MPHIQSKPDKKKPGQRGRALILENSNSSKIAQSSAPISGNLQIMSGPG